MASVRITRYDPKNRLPSGAYGPITWTASSDIGRIFEGEVLTTESYMAAEDGYVAFVDAALDAAGVSELSCTSFEEAGPGSRTHELPQAQEVAAAAQAVGLGARISKGQMGLVVRAVLRELIWCKLEGEGGFFIHFGYDLYMYAGSDRDIDFLGIRSPGVFVEPFDSPYHEEE